MIKNIHLMIFSFVCLFLSDATLFAQNKKNKCSTESKGDFRLYPPYLGLGRQFIEEMLVRHPLMCGGIIGGLLGHFLYPEVKPAVTSFLHEYRNVVGAAAFVALAVSYLRREAILKACVGSIDEYEDENEENEGSLALQRLMQSGVRVYGPGEIKTKFADVAGLETAKEDMNDLVMFLKDPTKFKKIGAKIPKGVLLSGSPGNGKTLLARAMAGEVGCPFLYIAGSEFMEAIVGVGAARVRSLFAIARELAPCIIFIDEIDTVGRKRSFSSHGGDSESTQTLNQLLAEMDGFEQDEESIVVIGATNRVSVLDDALLRAGRFDRKIEITLPYIKNRIEILSTHLKKVKASSDINVEKIAQGTPGFSGAELAELINEAAILAVRENALSVSMDHIDQARDFMLLGRETKGMEIEPDEYWVTAVHEAGHALMFVYQRDIMNLYKVTITPRGGALGLTHGMEVKEKYSRTEREMKATIKMLLGGSVAEEMIFGHRGVGASNDIGCVRRVASSMVMQYGMTEEFKDVSFSEFIDNQVHLPDQIATKLHQAVAKVVSECRAVTEAILLEHKATLLELARMLMDQGTVTGSDVYKLCGVAEPSGICLLKA